MYTLPEISARRVATKNTCLRPRPFFAIYYKTKDDAFKAASNTWANVARHTESFETSRDMLLQIEIASESDFKTAWTEVSRVALKQKLMVWCGHILTHASKQTDQNDGLEMKSDLGNDGTLRQFEICHLEKLPWAKEGYLLLDGCNTGLVGGRGWAPANDFALTQRVLTIGQAGYAYFSSSWNTYSEKSDNSSEVCLWAFRRGKNDAFGNGERVLGKSFRY